MLSVRMTIYKELNMKKAAIVVISLMLSACVSTVYFFSPSKAKDLNVAEGLEDDFDELLSGAEKYESEGYVGYRVNFGAKAEPFFDNLRIAVSRTCQVHNSTQRSLYLFSNGGPYIRPINIYIPDSELPLPPKTITQDWSTKYEIIEDLICADYDDETSYPSKRTLRALEYIKIRREFEKSDPEDDKFWSNGHGHVILLKPQFVFEKMILPTQKEYEEDYIQKLREAKTIVAALEGDLQNGIKIRVVIDEKSDKHQVNFVVDNQSGTTPIKLKLSSVGDLQIDNARYSVSWTEFSDGKLNVSFDWNSDCSPIEKNHYVTVNPTLTCVAKLPVTINGAKFTLDKKYSISVFARNLELKPISKYDLINKHPTAFNELP